ncbi:AAA family ATPase [Candidatus Caldatribacterium saccharofermentans]|uniref:ExeA family protein n=1 Tax=Candidatus Caldatribacterium saccharofermentans TaxID=1454753 RepID=UPI003CFCE774
MFLEELLRKCPFPVRAIQVDGGSEFYGEFEEACKEYGIKLFVLPPRSPKLNGVVERLNRTFREEFWAYCGDEVDLETMRFHLERWTEEVYNRRKLYRSSKEGTLLDRNKTTLASLGKDYYARCCRFFGFTEYPFRVLPDPRYLYFTEQHQTAYRRAIYSIDSGSAFAAIWGSMGLGKTSLAYYLIHNIPEIRPHWEVHFIESAGSFGSFLDVYRRIIAAFGKEAHRNMAENDRTLKEVLFRKAEQNIRPVFIIDELQEAPFQALKALRTISNIETPSTKLIQFILLGSEEVFRKFDRIPAFRDRLVFPTSLSPLDFQDMRQMIGFRLNLAGCDERIFTESQLENIFLHSLGIPRHAVLICSNALRIALDRGQREITDDVVQQAIELFEEGRRRSLWAEERKPKKRRGL